MNLLQLYYSKAKSPAHLPAKELQHILVLRRQRLHWLKVCESYFAITTRFIIIFAAKLALPKGPHPTLTAFPPGLGMAPGMHLPPGMAANMAQMAGMGFGRNPMMNPFMEAQARLAGMPPGGVPQFPPHTDKP
jgi:hypothetical protein